MLYLKGFDKKIYETYSISREEWKKQVYLVFTEIKNSYIL